MATGLRFGGGDVRCPQCLHFSRRHIWQLRDMTHGECRGFPTPHIVAVMPDARLWRCPHFAARGGAGAERP